jgi:hypothetical protein
MSQFSSLMNQYGSEAETQKVEEHRADRRSETFRKLRRVCLLLVVLAAFAAAAVYRTQVQSVIATVTNKFHPPSPYAKAEANTKGKLGDINKEAEQRKEAIEATFR